jgi:hypothetical protein
MKLWQTLRRRKVEALIVVLTLIVLSMYVYAVLCRDVRIKEYEDNSATEQVIELQGGWTLVVEVGSEYKEYTMSDGYLLIMDEESIVLFSKQDHW